MGASTLALALAAEPARAANGVTSFAYVPSGAFDETYIINTATNAVIANIATGGAPYGTAISPDGSTVYIVNYTGDNVSVIDAATGTVSGTISVADGPNAVAVSPDGSKVYVTNRGSNSVSVIDTASGAVSGTINVGSTPQSVAFSPDGNRAYVTNNGSNNVSVIDTASGTVVNTIGVGSLPVGVSVSPDGSKVYVINRNDSNVSIIDTASGTVSGTINVGFYPSHVAFSPDGTKAYVTNTFDNNVSVINTSTSAVTATIPVGYSPSGVAFTADGGKAYVINYDNDSVSVIDTATNTVTTTIPIPGWYPLSATQFVGPSLVTGEFEADSDAALTAAGFGLNPAFGNSLNFAGGTLVATNNFSTSRPVYLSAAYNLGGGTFTSEAGGTVDTDGYLVFLFGTISGPGSLTKAGAGTLLLSGTNSYTGGTVVVEGTLLATSPGGFVQNTAYTVNGGVLDLNDFDLTMSSLSGSGGTVDLGAADLTIDQSATTSFAGNIIGTGSLIKTGAGTTTLTGVNTYTGATTVSRGRLVVNGSLTNSTVNVLGGTLGGSGALGSVTIGNGGIFAPGNSIGTATVGTWTLNTGAIYEVEIKAGGNTPGTHNDLTAVTGLATIDGAIIHVTPENGTDTGATYADGTVYTILQAGTLSVTAAPTVTDDFAYLDFTGSYDARNFYLTAGLVSSGGGGGGTPITSFCLAGMSANQCATGDGAFSLGAGNSVYDAVLTMTATEAAAALDALSGEIHASAQSVFVENTSFVREAAFERLREERPRQGDETLWTRLIGNTGTFDGNGNAASLDNHETGFITGADGLLFETWRLGAMAGYSRTSFDADGRASSGDSDNLHLGLYGGTRWSGFGLRFGLAHTWHKVETERHALGQTLEGDYDARTFQAFGELGYRPGFDAVRFEPFANAAWIGHRTDGFAETGGAAALHVSDGDSDTGFTTLGLRAGADFALGGITVTPGGALGWRHAFGDTVPDSTNALAGGTAFTVAGAPVAKNAALIEAGLDLRVGDSLTFSFGYAGQFAGNARSQGGTLKLSLAL